MTAQPRCFETEKPHPCDGVAAVSPCRRVYVVDDDVSLRKAAVFLLTAAGMQPRAYDSGDAFVAAAPMLQPGCVLLDMCLPRMNGEAVVTALGPLLATLPVIAMSGHGDVAAAVRMMRKGVVDFIEKPLDTDTLLTSLDIAFAGLDARAAASARQAAAHERLARLGTRERAVLAALAQGHPNKVIAWQLDLSVRTVEMYRGRMMERLGIRSLAEALQLLFDAGAVAHPVTATELH